MIEQLMKKRAFGNKKCFPYGSKPLLITWQLQTTVLSLLGPHILSHHCTVFKEYSF